MKRAIKIVLIITVLMLLYKYNRYLRPGIPTSIQLAQTLTSDSRVEFWAPKGNLFSLILGFQDLQDSIDFPTCGTIRLLDVDENELFYKEFQKDDLLNTNWLHGKGYFVRSPAIVSDGNILHLDEHIRPRRNYYIVFSFPESMPSNVSIWISYLR